MTPPKKGKKMRRYKCRACEGLGQIWVGDSSPDGLVDCKHCCEGYYYVTSNGRHIQYPGGLFCGQE